MKEIKTTILESRDDKKDKKNNLIEQIKWMGNLFNERFECESFFQVVFKRQFKDDVILKDDIVLSCVLLPFCVQVGAAFSWVSVP